MSYGSHRPNLRRRARRGARRHPPFDGERIGTRDYEEVARTAGGDRCLGFSMILYPTSLLFRAIRAIERGLADLRQGKRMASQDGVDLQQFEEIVNLDYWAAIEKRFD